MSRTRHRCITLGAAAIAVVLGCSLTTASAQGVPGVSPNKCLSGKTKCVDKKVAGLLKCREKCQKDSAKCGAVQGDCEAKVRLTFDNGIGSGCFDKLEAKQDSLAPETVCTTEGDRVPMANMADSRQEGEPTSDNPPTVNQARPANRPLVPAIDRHNGCSDGNARNA